MKNERELRAGSMPFAASNDAHGIVITLVDMLLWIALAALAILAEPWWMKTLLAMIAGTTISTLFVLGHDAAHFSLTKTRWLNAFLARLAFLPALHNLTLWRIQHNRLHHRFPNVKGLNSWSPLSPDEFRALPAWRQWVERFYRSGFGTGPYYLVERWWKHKFFPRQQTHPNKRRAAWADFALLAAWLATWVTGAIAIGELGGKSAVEAVLFGVAIPYFVWNVAMGLTIFLQHTHPRAPWFKSPAQAQALGQEHLSVHVRYPRWLGFISHEIMEHPAHHVNPMIPFYNLRAAQAWLNERLGSAAISEPLTPRLLLDIVQQCKLYDYERHEWRDFQDKVTAFVPRSAGGELVPLLR